MKVAGSQSAGRHRANGSIGAFAVIGPVVGGLTMSALVTGAVLLLAGGSQPDDATPDIPARTYTTEQTVADDAPPTTSTTERTTDTTRTTSTANGTSSAAESPTTTRRARPTTTTPPPAATAKTTTDGPPERCPGNQPEHVRRKVCD